jgi:hypothetical protein
MTPVRLRAGASPGGAVDNFGVEGMTLGESKVLQGLGRDLGESRGNSFEKFTFNLEGQSPGAVAQLGGTAYTDTLVLTTTTGGTMRLHSDANITQVKTLVVGDADSSEVKLEVGAYNGGTLKIGGDSISAPIAQVLKGNGTIIGDIIIGAGAVVKPGNSPGPLSFVGNVLAMPGSELQFEYTANRETTPSSGPHDTIAITGSLRAKGGIVAVAYDPNGRPRITDFKKHTLTIMTYTVGTVSDVNGSVPSYMNVGGTLRQTEMILASVSSGTVGLIQMTVERRRFSSLGDGNVEKIGALLDSKLSLSDGPISNFIDILDAQNGLQIQELSLDFQPHVHDVLRDEQELLPVFGAIFERLDVGRRHHDLRFHNVIIEKSLNFIHACRRDDVSARVSVWRRVKLDGGPVCKHPVQGLLERPLLRSTI